MAMQRLALFDLDHTLLPIDSDYEWGRFLSRIGVVDGDSYEQQNQAFYEQYKAGTLDIGAFMRFSLAPLANRPAEELAGWHARYMAEVIRPTILPQARRLVDDCLQRGDLVAIVTATNTFVTRPIATEFGVTHLIGSECEQIDGRYTGRPAGVPSFREGKITRTHAWLADLGKRWQDFDEIWFWSDSANDLPLLEAATHPVATNPDPVLRAVAASRGWPIVDLFPQ
jgi:HAD superfamily hydrolase (TIGR01490 family)